MSDEDKLTQATARAVRAQALLGNDLLQEAYDALEAQYIAAWIGTPVRDAEGRERCWSMVQANRNHRDHFVSMVTNGKLARAELKHLAETSERRKRFGLV